MKHQENKKTILGLPKYEGSTKWYRRKESWLLIGLISTLVISLLAWGLVIHSFLFLGNSQRTINIATGNNQMRGGITQQLKKMETVLNNQSKHPIRLGLKQVDTIKGTPNVFRALAAENDIQAALVQGGLLDMLDLVNDERIRCNVEEPDVETKWVCYIKDKLTAINFECPNETFEPFRQVKCLRTEYLHCIVTDTTIRSITEIEGKKVSMSNSASGTHFVSSYLLAHLNLLDKVEITQQDAAADVIFFFTSSLPSEIQRKVRHQEYRILPLDFASAFAHFDGLFEVQIPKYTYGLYPSVDIPTIGANLHCIVHNNKIDNSEVKRLRIILDNVADDYEAEPVERLNRSWYFPPHEAVKGNLIKPSIYPYQQLTEYKNALPLVKNRIWLICLGFLGLGLTLLMWNWHDTAIFNRGIRHQLRDRHEQLDELDEYFNKIEVFSMEEIEELIEEINEHFDYIESVAYDRRFRKNDYVEVFQDYLFETEEKAINIKEKIEKQLTEIYVRSDERLEARINKRMESINEEENYIRQKIVSLEQDIKYVSSKNDVDAERKQLEYYQEKLEKEKDMEVLRDAKAHVYAIQTTMNELTKARSYIAGGKLEDCFMILKARVSKEEDIEKTLDMLESRYSQLKQRERQGTNSSQEISLERNTITKGLLDVIGEVKKGLKEQLGNIPLIV